MSAADRSPYFNLERLKKDAKRLLRACRAGDASAVSAIQAALPGLRALLASEVARTVQLADVHQALALQRGFASWADLARDANPLSRLFAAVRGGHVRTLRRELADFSGLAGQNVCAACGLGDEGALARLLGRDPALATAQTDGWPPLMYVCASPIAQFSARHASSLIACAELLLDAGVDPNTRTTDDAALNAGGVPAILRALMSRNMALVVLLKNRGAVEPFAAARQWHSTQVKPDANSATLHLIFGEFARRPEAQEALQNAKAGLEARGQVHGRLPSDPREMLQIRMPNLVGAQAHLWDAMVDGGHFATAMAPGGQSPLHAVATFAPAAFVEMFLSRGGNLNVRDDQGRSVIAAAVRAGNTEVADLLRAHGLTDDATPIDRLLGACLAGDSDRARQLAAEYPDVPAAFGREDVDTLVRAAGRGNLVQVRLMLDVGIRPDDRDEAGVTALHQAAWRGQVEIVRLLTERGASVTVRDDLYQQTPREWAIHGSLHALGSRDRCIESARILEEAKRAGG